MWKMSSLHGNLCATASATLLLTWFRTKFSETWELILDWVVLETQEILEMPTRERFPQDTSDFKNIWRTRGRTRKHSQQPINNKKKNNNNHCSNKMLQKTKFLNASALRKSLRFFFKKNRNSKGSLLFVVQLFLKWFSDELLSFSLCPVSSASLSGRGDCGRAVDRHFGAQKRTHSASDWLGWYAANEEWKRERERDFFVFFVFKNLLGLYPQQLPTLPGLSHGRWRYISACDQEKDGKIMVHFNPSSSLPNHAGVFELRIHLENQYGEPVLRSSPIHFLDAPISRIGRVFLMCLFLAVVYLMQKALNAKGSCDFIGWSKSC